MSHDAEPGLAPGRSGPTIPHRVDRLARRAAVLLLICLLAGCGAGGATVSSSVPPPAPAATPFGPPVLDLPPPAEKLAETASPAFTQKLYDEAVALAPGVARPGTHVHLGYWSGNTNRSELVGVLDALNQPSPTEGPRLAIWDEGVSTSSSQQYPSYRLMNDELWYERANATGDHLVVNGATYLFRYPVTLQQADDIWGQYSQRYTDMARPIHNATGQVVDAWCTVIGAKANRVFYKYELPELRIMEAAGDVRVHFALRRSPNPAVPDDWVVGTANAPPPSSKIDEQPETHPSRAERK